LGFKLQLLVNLKKLYIMKKNSIAFVDESTIIWKEFISKNGNKYEVGYLKKLNLEDDAASNKGLGKSDFGICVSWPVGTDRYKNTTPKVDSVASISRYALYDQNGTIYKYILYFTNSQRYNYYFYDETGDHYQVNTFRDGNHYVRFNSNKPNITFFSGS